jgi:phage protein U
MLFQLGGIQFVIAPLNIYQHSFEASTDYVEKPIVGMRAPLEWVGEGPMRITLEGRLFPKRFGGLDGLAMLQMARLSGIAQFAMRGDGVPFGWFVIERVTERSTYLAIDGVGQIIEFEVALRADTMPGAAGYFGSIMGMLGV